MVGAPTGRPRGGASCGTGARRTRACRRARAGVAHGPDVAGLAAGVQNQRSVPAPCTCSRPRALGVGQAGVDARVGDGGDEALPVGVADREGVVDVHVHVFRRPVVQVVALLGKLGNFVNMCQWAGGGGGRSQLHM